MKQKRSDATSGSETAEARCDVEVRKARGSVRVSPKIAEGPMRVFGLRELAFAARSSHARAARSPSASSGDEAPSGRVDVFMTSRESIASPLSCTLARLGEPRASRRAGTAREAQRSSGFRPLSRAMRRRAAGPTSALSWKAKVICLQPGRARRRCEPRVLTITQPIRCKASRTRRGLTAGHSLTRRSAGRRRRCRRARAARRAPACPPRREAPGP